MWRRGKRCSADVYWSPTRDEGDITEHSDIDRIGEETVELFRNIPLRNDPSDGGGMEGMGVLVVQHDNLDKNPDLPPNTPSSQMTTLVTDDPAPPSGDPLNYSTMIYRSADRMKIGGRSTNAPLPLAMNLQPKSPLSGRRGGLGGCAPATFAHSWSKE